MADTVPQAEEDIAQIRESVRALCAKFPGEYWRKLDRERAYPTEFVAALTQAGFLAVLIPEQYGGSGLSMTAAAAIMEEIHASGCNGAACHAQMYTMGTLLRHGSAAQKSRWLPAIAAGELRLQAFGVTEPTSGSDTLNLRTTAVREAAARYQAGHDCAAEANMAKLLAADASWAAADTCLQTHGGFGFAEEFDVERKFRETRLYQVAPISTNLILSYVAEHVLGLPRSY